MPLEKATGKKEKRHEVDRIITKKRLFTLDLAVYSILTVK